MAYETTDYRVDMSTISHLFAAERWGENDFIITNDTPTIIPDCCDVVVFLDPGAEIDDQLFELMTMMCDLNIVWTFVYCPVEKHLGHYSRRVWIEKYFTNTLLHMRKIPQGIRYHIALEDFMQLPRITCNYSLLLAQLAYNYSGDNLIIKNTLVSQGSRAEESFNMSEDSKRFLDNNNDKVFEISTDICKKMYPTNSFIDKLPNVFKKYIYFVGYQFLLCRMPPDHPVAHRFAPGLISQAEKGSGRNLIGVMEYYNFVHKDEHAYRDLAITNIGTDAKYFILSQNYLDSINGYTYADKEATIFSLAKMNKALDIVFSDESSSVFNDMDELYVSGFTAEDMLESAVSHKFANLNKFYPKFCSDISDMDGFLKTLNPLYDLFAGFLLYKHIKDGTPFIELINMSPEEFIMEITELM